MESPQPELEKPWTHGRFAVIDIEGNGQSPPEFVELAVVYVDSGVIGASKSWLVRPSTPITSHATRIHRIKNSDVSAAPNLADVEPEIVTALSDRYWVAHNAAVDWGVLHRQLPALNPPAVLDTLRLARTLQPGQASYSLPKLLAAWSLTDQLTNLGSQPHRANYDAHAAALLFLHLLQSEDAPIFTLGELLARCALTPKKKPKQEKLFDP